MNDDDTIRIALAEAFGTMLLVLGGCGTAILATGNYGGVTVGVLGVATAFGLAQLISCYAIGGISGSHINPAVTLAMVVARKTPAKLLPIYWISQVVGGLFGGLILWATIKLTSHMPTPSAFASNGFAEGSPGGFSLGSVALIEIVFTALFVLVVISTTHKKFPAGFGGIAIGLALWLTHLVTIPVSNTSVNPARSLAVAPFAPSSLPLEQVWAFIVFPLIGAVVGAAVWMLIGEPSPSSSTSTSGPTSDSAAS